MFELIYKNIYLQNTAESKMADDLLTKKINAFLQDKQIECLGKEGVEELIYLAGTIGHEEGFLCAVRFFKKFFSELLSLN